MNSRWLVIGVTGSRYATRANNWATISEALRRRCDKWDGKILVIHGACPDGVDEMADWFAAQSGYHCKRFPADWSTQGRAAGPIRNSEMVRATHQAQGNGHEVYWYGFPAKNAPCRGTTNCISQAKSAGLTVIEIPIVVPYARHKRNAAT